VLVELLSPQFTSAHRLRTRALRQCSYFICYSGLSLTVPQDGTTIDG
jgi:hypothetical protein